MPPRKSIAAPVDKIEAALEAIRATKQGCEPSMYPFIRDIFAELGHSVRDIQTDTRTSTGGRPDVKIDAQADGVFLNSWIVVEAKDEEGR